MFKRLLLISPSNRFNRNLSVCLGEEYKFYSMPNIDEKHLPTVIADIIILNGLSAKFDLNNLRQLLDKISGAKIIYLEDANELYLNTDNKSPFSVYAKIISKNDYCRSLVEIENLIMNYSTESVIFRVSDIYGLSCDFGLIYQILSQSMVTLGRGERDFIYDGDVINAIEVALEAEAEGIFNIASGKTVSMDIVLGLIGDLYQKRPKIKWTKENNCLGFECENFKFYKWQPLIELRPGLSVMRKLLKFQR